MGWSDGKLGGQDDLSTESGGSPPFPMETSKC